MERDGVASFQVGAIWYGFIYHILRSTLIETDNNSEGLNQKQLLIVPQISILV